jgi:glutamate-1-semialdehyde 2,1-aminomutase
MMGSGGCIAGDPEFLAMLRREATAAGALLIFDEVMTSRLSDGGRQKLLDIRPDLTTLGKYLGGGMSFGAFGGRADIMELFDPGRPGALPHAGTFNNNVITMAAGVAALDKVLTPDAIERLNARGDALREGLDRFFRDARLPFVANGLGSLVGFHPTTDQPRNPDDLSACDPRMRELVFLDLLEDGFYLARRGLIALSLPVGEAETGLLLDAMNRRADRWRAAFADQSASET